jgi:hypothetical protein
MKGFTLPTACDRLYLPEHELAQLRDRFPTLEACRIARSAADPDTRIAAHVAAAVHEADAFATLEQRERQGRPPMPSFPTYRRPSVVEIVVLCTSAAVALGAFVGLIVGAW